MIQFENAYQTGKATQPYENSEDLRLSNKIGIVGAATAGVGIIWSVQACIEASEGKFMYVDKFSETEIYPDMSTGKYYVPNESVGYTEIEIPDTQVGRIPLNYKAENCETLGRMGLVTGMAGASVMWTAGMLYASGK
jgi:hypothetical protein